MQKKTTGARCLLVTMFLLGTTGTTLAEPLIPLYENQVSAYHARDAHDSVGWTWLLEVMGSKVSLGSHEYFHTHSWNDANSGQFEDTGDVRSTEQATYGYNPAGEEFLWFQKMPVGTKWSIPYQQGMWSYTVIEVVAIEAVTVPYGTFDQAYKYHYYGCNDPGDPHLGKSPDWYFWVVPGIGYVRYEDYRTNYPPMIMELTGLSVAPVYRFWSPVHSRHFYTISEAEKRKLITTYSHIWTYNSGDTILISRRGVAVFCAFFRFFRLQPIRLPVLPV